MNHSTHNSSKKKISLTLSKASDGFIKFKIAEGLSHRTIESYEYYLRQWIEKVGDQDCSNIRTSDLVDYLAWLRTDYKPKRWNGNKAPYSPKSLKNAYTALKSFFNWLTMEFNLENPFVNIPPPKFPAQSIEIFTKEEIEKLLKACVYSREVNPSNRRSFVMRRPSGDRDKAILLTLLDTGMRAGEICSLLVEDLDQKTGKIRIKQGISGGAKGGKGRTVFLGKVACKVVWLYSAKREHWRWIRTNNAMERLNLERRIRTKSIGAFPDGQSALMLVCARLRYIEQSEWGQKTFLNMEHLEELLPGDF